ncbi:MAG: hypothetical protein RLZZ288_1597, partial [Planctomycetota bacterium]
MEQAGGSSLGEQRGATARALAMVERLGNRLPDPATLFVMLGVVVLALSFIGARMEWSVADPRTPGASATVRNLVDAEGIKWILTSALKN